MDRERRMTAQRDGRADSREGRIEGSGTESARKHDMDHSDPQRRRDLQNCVLEAIESAMDWRGPLAPGE